MLDWVDKGLIPLLVAIIGTSATLYIAHMPSKRSEKATLRKLKALLRVVYRSLDVTSIGAIPSMDAYYASAESQFNEFVFGTDTLHGLNDEQANALYELAYSFRSSLKSMQESVVAFTDLTAEDNVDVSDDSALSEHAISSLKMKLDYQLKSMELINFRAKIEVDQTWRLAVMSLHLLGEDRFLKQVTLDMHRERLDYVLTNGMSGKLPRIPTETIKGMRDTLDLAETTSSRKSAEGTGGS